MAASLKYNTNKLGLTLPVRIMKARIEAKLKAVALRKRGYSLSEIIKSVGASKSSVSVWVRNVPLTTRGRERLLTKIKLGQLISAENKHKRTRIELNGFVKVAEADLEKIVLDSLHVRFICALLYWCEGTKNYFQGVNFINSDSRLVSTFLRFFRKSFQVDEKKFRCCVHIHEYHNAGKQVAFWSKVTDIPKKQFIKPYLKPHTGNRIETDYQGCVSIRYHDNTMARRLYALGETFIKNMGL